MTSAIKQLTFALGLGSILWTAESAAATRLNVYEFKSGTATATVNLDQAKAAETLSKSDESMLLAADIANTSDDEDKDKERKKCRHTRKCKSPH